MGSSVPQVLGEPNQRQTLNSSCSRPIKTLLGCRLPLLKSDIRLINKSQRQARALASFCGFVLFFLPIKYMFCPITGCLFRNLSAEWCPLGPVLSPVPPTSNSKIQTSPLPPTPGFLQAGVGPGFLTQAGRGAQRQVKGAGENRPLMLSASREHLGFSPTSGWSKALCPHPPMRVVECLVEK